MTRRRDLGLLAAAGGLILLLATGAGVPAHAAVAVEVASDPEVGEAHGESDDGAHDSSAVTDEYIPLLEDLPERPRLLLELGNPYLGTGNINPGFKLPTGAVWQPTLIVFGTLRSAIQSFEVDDFRITEWANRLDLFANLQLTGTERLVLGFRNFDQDGRFTSYILEPSSRSPEFQALFGDDDAFRDELNAEIQSLYFEGEFGEIFPGIDKQDFGRTDVGFSIGRQLLIFQEGMLINDSIDGVGITRNTLLPKNTSNFRATLFFGASDLHRNNVEDGDAELFAVLTSTDVRTSTIDVDLAYVTGSDSSGDLVGVGVSAVQRIGKINTSFRLLSSLALDEETAFATDGTLLFSEVSWTPHHSFDLFYFTTFLALDEYSAAASGPASGGPLGPAGVSFAAVGLGNYGAPLSSRARNVAGGAIGYQKFYGPLARRQLLGELGLRVGTASGVANQAAATVRYQMAKGKHVVLVWDGFASYIEGLGASDDLTGFGGRFELVLKF
ncbi:MAG: hypothetical protein ACE5GX_00845 [Thermoanaerobaculia bacterium]